MLILDSPAVTQSHGHGEARDQEKEGGRQGKASGASRPEIPALPPATGSQGWKHR